MPGKNTQDWTADEDFWDEAWLDMEQRLDGKRKRRGVALWLRWLVPLVLVLAGAAFLISRQVNNSLQTDQPAVGQQITAPLVSVPPVTELPAPGRDNAPSETGRNIPKGSPPGLETNNTVLPSPRTASLDTSASSGTLINEDEQAFAPLPVASSPSGRVATDPASVVPAPAPAAAAEQRENTAIGTVQIPEKTVGPDPINEEYPAAIAINVLTAPHRQPDAPDDLPPVSITKTARSLPFGVEAGFLLADRAYLPGYYAGIFTDLRNTKTVSFPISLRYQTDRLRVEVSRPGNADDPLLDVGMGVNNEESFLLNSAAGRPLDELRLTSLSLGAGTAVRVTPRLRAGAGVSGSYLLSVQGITDLSFENDVYNFIVSGDGSQAEFSGSGQTPTTELVRLLQSSGLGLSDNNGLHRMQMRAHANLSYTVRPRLEITGSLDVRTTPLFKSDLLRVRPTQFALGLRYRLR